MARRIKAVVKIADITFDEELYPRASYSWQTGYDYSQSMRAGTKFPPIVLALLNNKKILVDGKHRIEAKKLLKEETIDAEVYTGWDRKKILEEAVRRNINHGRALSPFDKRQIALKLKAMDFKPEEISELIQVPMDKLERFIAQRLINAITGETIKEVIVKSEIKNLAGKTYDVTSISKINDAQEEMFSKSQVRIVESLINLISNEMLDTSDEDLMGKIGVLKKLLEKFK